MKAAVMLKIASGLESGGWKGVFITPVKNRKCYRMNKISHKKEVESAKGGYPPFGEKCSGVRKGKRRSGWTDRPACPTRVDRQARPRRVKVSVLLPADRNPSTPLRTGVRPTRNSGGGGALPVAGRPSPGQARQEMNFPAGRDRLPYPGGEGRRCPETGIAPSEAGESVCPTQGLEMLRLQKKMRWRRFSGLCAAGF